VGQEILYCNKCGKKLIGDDFTRGRAHTFNNRQYCTACLPQSVSSAAQAAQPAPRPAAAPARVKAAKPATARATAPAKSSAPVLIGVAIAAAAAVAVAVVLSTRPSEPPPEPPVAKAPAPLAAPAKPEPPKPEPPKPAVPVLSKEKIAEDMKQLEAKIDPTIKKEQFSAVIDLLEETRKRYAAPEWDQEVSKRIKAVEDLRKSVYLPLKAQAVNAQLRGGLAEAQQSRARLALWGSKELLDDFDKALAAVIPHEPLPAGAQVLVQFPQGNLSKYRYKGVQKDGALVGVPEYNGTVVGFESGLEIAKVPTEGQAWVVYSTDSGKPVTMVFRAGTVNQVTSPFNYFEQQPVAGRPQVLKFPIGKMKNWDNELIRPGLIINNIYFRQDDPKATLTVHEVVIFKTKD
jgi:hypothetical protein